MQCGLIASSGSMIGCFMLMIHQAHKLAAVSREALCLDPMVRWLCPSPRSARCASDGEAHVTSICDRRLRNGCTITMAVVFRT